MTEAFRCDYCMEFFEGKPPAGAQFRLPTDAKVEIPQSMDTSNKEREEIHLDLCKDCIRIILNRPKYQFSNHSNEKESVDQQISDVIEESPRKWDGKEAEKREEAVRTALVLLKGGWEGYSHDLVREVSEEIALDEISYDTWWDQTFKPALDLAEERQLVEHGKNNIWRWVG
jgi:hypothetical protein